MSYLLVSSIVVCARKNCEIYIYIYIYTVDVQPKNPSN